MQDAGELRASLAGYREQLRAVEAHLESEGLEDAQRSELEQVRKDLVEVIGLTQDLVKDSGGVVVDSGGQAAPAQGVAGDPPAKEEGYAPVAAPKLHAVSSSASGSRVSETVPERLVVRPGDDERTKVKKRKILKQLKKKERFAEMDRKQDEQKTSWLSFQKKKGTKKKKGFFTGRKKESMFKTSDAGRVGVVGGGRGMTDNSKKQRHKFDLEGAEEEQG